MEQELSPVSEAKKEHVPMDSQPKNSEFTKMFGDKISAAEGPEAALLVCIELMETSLSQPKTPQFKQFWEVRREALNLFKDRSISPIVRGQQWSKFVELTQQARQLKKIFEEQSAFAVDQISAAIDTIENELQDVEGQFDKTPEVQFENVPQILVSHLNYYLETQRRIQFYNALASKINDLRKELLKTEMRIGVKNKLFQRLSKAGDFVFPPRKEWIQKISSRFLQDVKEFLTIEAVNEKLPPFRLKEQIKDLQYFAKEISLNTPSFSEARQVLSQKWEDLKELEKQRKRVHNEQKEQYKQNFEEIVEQIRRCAEHYNNGELKPRQAIEQLENIVKDSKEKTIGPFEKKALQEEITKVREPIFEQLKQEKSLRNQLETERKEENKKAVWKCVQELEELSAQSEELELRELKARLEETALRLGEISFEDNEGEKIQMTVELLKDSIMEKEHGALLGGGTATEKVLQKVYEEKLVRRSEIKNQYEKRRKAAGTSGKDFEQAIFYQEQLIRDRERLEQIEQAIDELEEKLA